MSARIPGYGAADVRTPDAWRAARSRVLREKLAAMPRTAGATVVIAGYGSDDALPIGDVNHDGSADVLSLRFQGSTPSVEVMSGRTGIPLWSSSESNAFGAVYVAAPGAASMVLMLSDSATGQDAFVAGGFEDVLTVTAVRADHGTQLWSTSINGLVEYDPAGFRMVGVGEFDGILARTTATPYLLLDRVSEGGALVAGGASIQPEAIDAATGALASVGPPLGGDDYPMASPVGDLNGDGTQDYLVASDGDAPVIEAVSGANGTPLWTTPLANPNGPVYVNFLAGSPDLTGDDKPDVLVGWFNGAGSQVAAWSGASGTSVWAVDGDYASPLGDIDHDGRSDTRVVTFGGTRMGYAAVSATGRTLWSRQISAPHGQPVIASYPVGDLNGDGAIDTYLRFTPRSTSPEGPNAPSLAPALAAYIVDGRTGRARATHDLGLPTGDSLSGHAMTFVQTAQTKHGVRITAYNGQTDRAYWRATIPSANVTGVLDSSVLQLIAGRRGILELLTGKATETIAFVDGYGGTTWSATYAIQSGGVLFP